MSIQKYLVDKRLLTEDEAQNADVQLAFGYANDYAKEYAKQLFNQYLDGEKTIAEISVEIKGNLNTNRTLGESTKRISEESKITIEDYASMVAESYSNKRLVNELSNLIEERNETGIVKVETIQARIDELKQE